MIGELARDQESRAIAILSSRCSPDVDPLHVDRGAGADHVLAFAVAMNMTWENRPGVQVVIDERVVLLRVERLEARARGVAAEVELILSTSSSTHTGLLAPAFFSP